jgi:hypothetical protein
MAENFPPLFLRQHLHPCLCAYNQGSGGEAKVSDQIPCPFVYANGKPCTGHITRVEAYKADIAWQRDASGNWRLSIGQPRSHFHLFCSEKGNHAGYNRQDDSRMKFYGNQLPAELWRAMTNAIEQDI